MSTSTSSHLRPISDFLLRHEPRVTEHADTAKASDFDVRQDAALRAFVALQKRGIEIEGDADFSSSLEEHIDISRGAIKFARYDAARKKFGDSRTSPAYRDLARTFSLDEMTESLSEESAVDSAISFTFDDAFDRIEHDYGGQLQALYDSATPEQREAIELMACLMHCKDLGESTNTDAIRSKLKRLRRQTGWRLATTLL